MHRAIRAEEREDAQATAGGAAAAR